VPEGALGYWRERFDELGVDQDAVSQRFGREVLAFRDPDQLLLELVADGAGADFVPWSESPVPAERAIRGFYGVTLTEAYADLTSRFLGEIMGFEPTAKNRDRWQFRAGKGDAAAAVEVLGVAAGARGQIAAGTVHHIAWRVAGDDEQQEWRERLLRSGTQVTPVRDRNYFRSIYFHEPGGVLFEIATDPPGFTIDESPEALGRDLRLPPWLEPERAHIESVLPPLETPTEAAGD
jgi:glyoxalase family protein